MLVLYILVGLLYPMAAYTFCVDLYPFVKSDAEFILLRILLFIRTFIFVLVLLQLCNSRPSYFRLFVLFDVTVMASSSANTANEPSGSRSHVFVLYVDDDDAEDVLSILDSLRRYRGGILQALVSIPRRPRS